MKRLRKRCGCANRIHPLPDLRRKNNILIRF
nr:MAG TPA: hypothetical protein [Caudoviricetes sp.]